MSETTDLLRTPTSRTPFLASDGHLFGYATNRALHFRRRVRAPFRARMTLLFSDRYKPGSLLLCLLPPQIEGSKLLRMTPDVCEDALALLDTSRSFSV